ncbi:MAG TPA: hypothetical protein VMP01_14210 [Pirellulaceae bacterium]|nr:hypothetical protein [Pirellulaceae bacterium]
MNAQFPLRSFGLLALILAAGQSGCCCFECIPHGTAPLKCVPPVSALTPRNPPCSYVDPMCYGYHATCWRSWPADCVPDCVEWYQHDALGPGKGELPSLAPLPPEPDQPQPAAPAAPEATPVDPQPEPAESSSLSPVRQAADYAALPPIITVRDVPIREPLPSQAEQPYSSRRSYDGR